jgi:putative ABC transport system ATP-binding protein
MSPLAGGVTSTVAQVVAFGTIRHSLRQRSAASIRIYNQKPFGDDPRLTLERLIKDICAGKGKNTFMAFFSKSAPTVPQPDSVAAEAIAPNALIGLRNIEKSYAHGTSRTYVLRRINLDVKEGEFISIMGPSGAGKSTLLHIIGMHDSAWTGEYYFVDQPVHKLAAKDRAKLHKQYVGFVFQSYHLLDHLTVYENLDIPLSYRDIRKSERESMVCDILDRFAIVGKKDLYPNQLSGGQQQLVAVARAVISTPKVILADEPTGNLHSSQGKEIMELFKKLNEGGTTIIQVTHSEANAAYGSRVVNLRDGWVVDE